MPPRRSANPQATAVRVLFNFNTSSAGNPTVLNVIVNGHVHTVPWPYPDNAQYDWRTFAVTIPVTDLVAGTNVVQLGGDVGLVYSKRRHRVGGRDRRRAGPSWIE
jgi:hypothetical protein